MYVPREAEGGGRGVHLRTPHFAALELIGHPQKAKQIWSSSFVDRTPDRGEILSVVDAMNNIGRIISTQIIVFFLLGTFWISSYALELEPLYPSQRVPLAVVNADTPGKYYIFYSDVVQFVSVSPVTSTFGEKFHCPKRPLYPNFRPDTLCAIFLTISTSMLQMYRLS